MKHSLGLSNKKLSTSTKKKQKTTKTTTNQLTDLTAASVSFSVPSVGSFTLNQAVQVVGGTIGGIDSVKITLTMLAMRVTSVVLKSKVDDLNLINILFVLYTYLTSSSSNQQTCVSLCENGGP